MRQPEYALSRPAAHVIVIYYTICYELRPLRGRYTCVELDAAPAGTAGRLSPPELISTRPAQTRAARETKQIQWLALIRSQNCRNFSEKKQRHTGQKRRRRKSSYAMLSIDFTESVAARY